VNLLGRRKGTAGRNTQRHVRLPHWIKGFSWKSFPARILLSHNPRRCGRASHKVGSLPVPFQEYPSACPSNSENPFVMASFGLGARYPLPFPLSCNQQVYKVAGSSCHEKGDCSVIYQLLERFGVPLQGPCPDHHSQRNPIHEPRLHPICLCPRKQDLIWLCCTSQ